MVIEIKENLHHDLKEEKQKKIKLLKFVDTRTMALEVTHSDIEDFKYYKIIEKSTGFENFLVMCWSGEALENINVYIAKYEK